MTRRALLAATVGLPAVASASPPSRVTTALDALHKRLRVRDAIRAADGRWLLRAKLNADLSDPANLQKLAEGCGIRYRACVDQLRHA